MDLNSIIILWFIGTLIFVSGFGSIIGSIFFITWCLKYDKNLKNIRKQIRGG